MTTNKAPTSSERSDDLRAEYALDYSRSRPNRFAFRMSSEVVAVVLDLDVAAFFDTSDSINRQRRLGVDAIPEGIPR